jgi:hypothetical protein
MKIKVGLAALVVTASALVAMPPAGAGLLATVSGQATCSTPGQYTVNWTIDLLVSANGQVTSAVLSGAAEGNVSFSPNPFQFVDEQLTGTSVIAGDTAGTVVLTVTIEFQEKGTFTYTLGTELELDGSCEAPPSTTTTTMAPSTTSTSQAAAVAQPRFTG